MSVGIERTPRSRWWDEDHPPSSVIPSFEIFAHNSGTSPIDARLELTAYDMHSQALLPLPDLHAQRHVTLLAGQNTELHSLKHESHGDRDDDSGPINEESLIVLCARLVDPISGTTLSRVVDWPEPFRYLHWAADTAVVAKVVDNAPGSYWQKHVCLQTNRPVKGCFVSAAGQDSPEDGPTWEDNMVDLLPGEKIILNVNGLLTNEVEIRFLNDWEL